MKWVDGSKTCSRESVAKGLAKGLYNVNERTGWFLTPLKFYFDPMPRACICRVLPQQIAFLSQ